MGAPVTLPYTAAIRIWMSAGFIPFGIVNRIIRRFSRLISQMEMFSLVPLRLYMRAGRILSTVSVVHLP